MAEGRTQLVVIGVPIVGELQDRRVALIAIADEGQGVAVLGVVTTAQQPHPQQLGVKGNRAFQIADAQHGVQESHRHRGLRLAEGNRSGKEPAPPGDRPPF